MNIINLFPKVGTRFPLLPLIGVNCLWVLLLLGGCASHSSWYGGSGTTTAPAYPESMAVAEREDRAAILQRTIKARLDRQVEELSKIADAKRTLAGLIVNSEKMLFQANSAELKPEGRQLLIEVAQVLSNFPEDLVLIAGHCDRRGSEAANQDLSEERAYTVADILIDDGVLPLESIRVRGFSGEYPVADNETPEGRAKNRRVELIINVDETKVPIVIR